MSFKYVDSKPKKFGISTLVRLMNDCLPEQIENEQDMQQLIDKLWPALVREHEPDDVQCPCCKRYFQDFTEESEFIGWHGKCVECFMKEESENDFTI